MGASVFLNATPSFSEPLMGQENRQTPIDFAKKKKLQPSQ
jgi:hypothetical protein